MENRYRKYRDMGKIEDGLRFYLNDLKDKSRYESGQFFLNNSVNPCVETSYEFVDELVFQVRAMHAEIQPLKVIHLGGDEVPLGAWGLSFRLPKAGSEDEFSIPGLEGIFYRTCC